MSAVTSHCPHCGSPLEADCDFCPSCGAPKLRPQVPQQHQPPHSWMGEAPRRDAAAQSGPLSAPQYATQVPYVPYVVTSPSTQFQDTGLANTGRIMGIIAISLMVVGLVPCVGWLNYINLPFSFVTIIICIVAASTAKSASARSSATLGLVLAIVADIVGFIRLVIGGGCL